MNEEVGLGVLIGFYEIAIGMDVLKPRLIEETPGIILAEGIHVQMILGSIGEVVAEPGQAFVDVLGFGLHVLSAIVVGVFATKSLI